MTLGKRRSVYLLFCGVTALLLVGSALLAINVGAVDLHPKAIFQIIVNEISRSLGGKEVFAQQWKDSAVSIVWELRLPKVLAAACIGAGLSLCGILMQSLTRNALAEPYVLGISSGASVGAVSSIVLGGLPFLGAYSVRMGAFCGAILASLLVFVFAGRKSPSTTRLVLTGMALSALFQAITNVIIFLSPYEKKVTSAMFWMTGSLSGILWSDIPVLAITVLLGLLVGLSLHRVLDAILMGEERAITVGVNVRAVKRVLIVVSSLITAILVSASGVIGFVGLVVPHVVRRLFGPSHARLIPASMLLGAVFLTLADMFARTLVKPQEMPIGILTALIGVPFFLVLLHKSGYRFGE